MSKQIWETKPLEIWDKAKELRAQWQRSINEAAEIPGHVLAHGNTGEFDWSVGFKALTIIEDNPVGSMMANKDDKFSRECRLASESRGWGRELCGYVQNCWGSQFLGREADGGTFPFRNMSIPFPDPCDQHLKRGQQCMDLSPIPRFGADWPMYLGPLDKERDKAFIEHTVYNYLYIIKGIERITGQRFDEERVIENLKVFPKLREHALRITRLMANIPAPIGQKELYSFYTLGLLTKVDPDVTLDFWKSFADEVQWRVDNQIAAVANERYRWMEAHPSPWHFLKYFRYMEQKYGAVCIGSQYSHIIANPIELKEDGMLGRVEVTPPPEGQAVRNAEDVLRSIFTEARGYRFKDDEYFRLDAITDFAKHFKVDGAIMPLWRGGVGCTLTRKEQGLRLSRMGVRVLHYEGSQPGDRTDLDEPRFLDQLDTWMESQGLEKLED